jgi:hypothetical protein
MEERGISPTEYEPFIRKKVRELSLEIIRKGDDAHEEV